MIVAMRFLKTIVIVLCFILDVKVRASDELVHVRKQAGTTEIDGADIETFKDGNIQVDHLESVVGLGAKTFATFNDAKIQLHHGHVFIGTGKRLCVISTKHIDITVTADSQISVDESEHKTLVSVLLGQASVVERLNQKDENGKLVTRSLNAGFRLWIGGLKSDGTKATGSLEAVDLQMAEFDIRTFGNVDPKNIDVALDKLKSYWTDAVDKVALQTQDEITGEMKFYRDWEKENNEREIASTKEKRDLTNRFRAHALDLPYKSEVSPSE